MISSFTRSSSNMVDDVLEGVTSGDCKRRSPCGDRALSVERHYPQNARTRGMVSPVSPGCRILRVTRRFRPQWRGAPAPTKLLLAARVFPGRGIDLLSTPAAVGRQLATRLPVFRHELGDLLIEVVGKRGVALLEKLPEFFS